MDEREAAWAAVHDAVARQPGWAVGPCQYHGEVALWHVAVIHVAVRGRQARRAAIEAAGRTEVEALEELRRLIERRVSGAG